jgi:ribosomal protein L11 methyltransferase
MEPGEWHSVTVTAPQFAEEAITALLATIGSSGVSAYHDADDTSFVAVTAYFPVSLPLNELVDQISSRVAKLAEFVDLKTVSITTGKSAPNDWAENWKPYYQAARITRYLTIIPSWDTNYHAQPQELLIRLDPGLSFGTGTHPTTVMALYALEQVIRGGETVIDVGTGSGVLAIAAVKLGASNVIATDLAHDAVAIAQANVNLNKAPGKIKLITSNLLNGISTKADLIVANILADVLLQLIPKAATLLNPDGYLILSGIFHDQVAAVTKAVQETGLAITTQLNQGDWYAIVAKMDSTEQRNYA